MRFVQHRAAALGAAVLSLAAASGVCAGQGASPAGPEGARRGRVGSVNLHRVKVLLDGDARTVWIGDSWCRMSRTDRLPYGALAAWPIDNVSAVCLGFKGGGGTGRATNYTSGPGALVDVNAARSWVTETNDGEPAHFALPVNDMTRVIGESGLVLTGSGLTEGRIQAFGINNSKFAETDNGPFSAPGESFLARLLYYAPARAEDLLERVELEDSLGGVLGPVYLRTGARPKWHLGGDPESGRAVDATPSQINAAAQDVLLGQNLSLGPQLAVLESPESPLVGSDDYWFYAGTAFWRVDAAGRREPGYYHTGLAQDSWSFAGLADDRESTGGKNYSDEQLRHWLDVTTLDRAQTPVVVVHVATEAKPYEVIEGSVLRILERYREAFAAIGTAPPRFLLVGSYVHIINPRSLAESLVYIEQLDAIYAGLAASEPDCAFFSLSAATDEVLFSTDAEGGAGTQQAARDWLDANGWSTITYGGNTYTLSSADDGGLDGVLTADGLHLSAAPAAAFYARLLGDAIAASSCPADFNGDGVGNTLDVIAFLNAWVAGDAGADIDGNGEVDTRDVLAFLNVWTAGC
ncbi:MAG: GC-type dockerin domain-anchored protein [Phycisphaerales bacterium JB054]